MARTMREQVQQLDVLVLISLAQVVVVHLPVRSRSRFGAVAAKGKLNHFVEIEPTRCITVGTVGDIRLTFSRQIVMHTRVTQSGWQHHYLYPPLGGFFHILGPGHHYVTYQRVTGWQPRRHRSEEHTSELQSRPHLVCRLLLEKKKKKKKKTN